jgi:hypothetical protein
MNTYGILLLAALVINWGDWRMFSLSAVVGIGVFIPVPDVYFYLYCALGEFLIALIALRISCEASPVIVVVSAMLSAFHGLGWILDGYQPESQYHAAVIICEHSELAVCAILSKPFTELKNAA